MSASKGIALRAPSGAKEFGGTIGIAGDGSVAVVADWRGGDDRNGAVTVYARGPKGWRAGAGPARPTTAYAFGRSVAISRDGGTIAVADRSGGDANNQGTVTIFTREDKGWSAGVALPRPDGAVLLGEALALSADGDTIVVADEGGGGDERGAVWVHRRTAVGWSAGVALARPGERTAFGSSVAVSGDGATIVVGDASGGGDGRGGVTLHTRTEAGWSEGIALARPEDAGRFGRSVAITGDGALVAVGDPRAGGPEGTGAVTLYTRAEGWSARASRSHGGLFGILDQMTTYGGIMCGIGTSVALAFDGSAIAVGGDNRNEFIVGQVAAIRIARTGELWSDGVTLMKAPHKRAFEIHVAIAGDGQTIVVGDPSTTSVRVFQVE